MGLEGSIASLQMKEQATKRFKLLFYLFLSFLLAVLGVKVEQCPCISQKDVLSWYAALPRSSLTVQPLAHGQVALKLWT